MESREYEILTILNPDMEEQATQERIVALIKDHDAEVQSQDVWGLRTLAYPIEKQSRGRYILFNVVLPTEQLSDLRRELGIFDGLLRCSIVSKETTEVN